MHPNVSANAISDPPDARPAGIGWPVEQVHGVLQGALDRAAFMRAARHAAGRHGEPPAADDAHAQATNLPLAFELDDRRDRGDTHATLASWLAHAGVRATTTASATAPHWQLCRLDADTHAFVVSQRSDVRTHGGVEACLADTLRAYASLVRDGALPAEADTATAASRVVETDEAFWRDYLAGLHAPTRPAVDLGLNARDGKDGEETVRTCSLDAATSALLRERCAGLGVSLDTLAHAAWARLLGAYSGEQDVLFGMALATGDVLPLRVRIDPQQRVDAWLAGLRDQLQRIQTQRPAHLAQLAPLSDMTPGQPLFETLLCVLPEPCVALAGEDLGGLRLISCERRIALAGCPFSMSIANGACLRLTLRYPAHRLQAIIADEWLAQFGSLLQRLGAEPQQRLWDVETIAGRHAERALDDWNDTRQPFDTELTLHGMVERQAAAQPERLAIVAGDGRLSYGELDARANQLAHQLIQLGVQPGDRVGLCTEKSVFTAIAMLGAMKAGAAYVPIDPGYPPSRIAYMAEDAGLRALLSWGRGTSASAGLELPRLALDTDWASVAAQPTTPTGRQVSADAFAYVIYTSGSTGQPKAVMLNHRGRVNNIEDYCRRLALRPQDRVLCVSSLSFDISVCNIFTMFRAGGCVVFPTLARAKDPEHWLELIEREAVSFWHSAPALFDALLDTAEEQSHRSERLRVALLGGDWIPLAQPDRARASFPALRFVTAGGATELSIDSTFYPVEQVDPDWRSIPYGRPLDNQSALILDPHMALAPIGVPGELYLGGIGMGAGYLRRPDLSAEKFVPHPWPSHPGERLYRTGDLAKYGADGVIELLGRIDFQVKIRGMRIELGEIEAVLREHPRVAACLAGAPAMAHGERRLVGYVVPADAVADEQQLHAELLAWLRERLPEHLIPEALVTLEHLPLTPNGKVDRRHLPAPAELGPQQIYEAPQGPLEQRLAMLWQSLLHVERIGRRDHFFALGGHSIHAVRLFSRLNRELDAELPLALLFEHPTVAALADALAARLAQSSAPASPAIAPTPRDDAALPLSFAQQRLWFVAQLEQVGAAYHMPLALRLRGPLDVAALRRALVRLYDRHEGLRTIFAAIDGLPRVELLPAGSGPELVEHDLRGVEAAESRLAQLLADDTQKPFDLAHGPLIRAGLVRLAEHEHVLLLTLHHIVSDGWSTGVLLHELSALYASETHDRAAVLPALEVQYPDYAAWQRRWLTGERLQAQADYWRRRLVGAPAMLTLPTDRPRPAQQSFAGAQWPLRIEAGLARELKQLSQRHGVTLFMTLMAAWATVLGRLAGQQDLVIGTPAANRGRAEIEALIGFFVNTLALRIDLGGNPTVGALLARVRRAALEAHAHQDLPFEQVVEVVNPPRRADAAPLFQVAFSWQNNDEGQLHLSGIAAELMPVPVAHAKFDLELSLSEQDGAIEGGLDYATALFDPSSAERLAHGLLHVLEQFVRAAPPRIDELALGPAQQLPPIVPAPPAAARMPLSWHQERVWFVDAFEAGHLYEASPVYHNIALILSLHGPVNTEALEQALNAVVGRHQALRTRVHSDDGQAWQSFDASLWLPLEIQAVAREELIAQAVALSRRPFALGAAAPLLRATWLRAGDQHSALSIAAHHLVADRASMRLLTRELFELYAARVEARAPRLAEPPLQYADYATWQRQLPAEAGAALRAYWMFRLAGRLQAMELPLQRPRMPVHLFAEARHAFRLGAPLSARLSEAAGHAGVPPSELALAAFLALLRRYTGHGELVVGTSADCREDAAVAPLLGPVANLLVLRHFVDADTRFADLLQQVHATVAEAQRHRHMQFDQLVLALHPDKDMSRTALFDVLFQFEDAEPEALKAGNLSVRTEETNLGYGKNDLHLLLHAEDGQWSGKLVYNALFFDGWFIEQMMAHYRVLLEAWADDASATIDAVPLLDAQNERRQLHDWNDSAAAYPHTQTVHQLFEAQAERTPDRLAVSLDGHALSYRELNELANRLAHRLRASGTQPQDLVALLLERSPDMIVAILGVMKSGAAYVPIDPKAPAERIDYILRDCGARQAVVSAHLEGSLSLPQIDVIALRDTAADFAEYPASNPGHVNTPDHLVYVIYTSGSTGLPKGALLEHRNVVRLMHNARSPFAFGADDVWSMFHSYAFDFSVWEMYGALLHGGRIALVPDALRQDPAGLLDFLAHEGVTVLNQTPSAFYALDAAMAQAPSPLPALRYVIFGGEGLDPARLRTFYRDHPHVALINMYGITETCVHVTFKQLGADEIDSGLSNVGRPLPTTTAYIMDEAQRLLPVGVPGEICVGGLGVGRGYLNRPELTAQRFVAHPYAPQERLYRSGDLGKLLDNGELVHLGRLDDQVKIRGFRIELGEIEAVLRELPGVAQCAVVVREDRPGLRQLVGYLVAATGHAADPAAVRQALAARLPDYMVPAAIVTLAALPLTINGKLDRQALPPPGADQKTRRDPRTPRESALSALFASVLGLDSLGIDDNFFELGGHSLLATRLIGLIRSSLDAEIPIRVLFESPTVAALAERLEQAPRSNRMPLRPRRPHELQP